MNKNALASISLAFTTAFVLAAPDGDAKRVGELSRSSDYVYTAVQADTMIHAARDAANAYTTAVSNKLSAAATTVNAGLMSAADKEKLDGIATGANAYVHPTYTARTGKPTADASPSFGDTFTVSQITSDSSGHVTGATDRTITIPPLPTASTSAAGIVQLSTSTNGTSIAKAATESAVKAALDGAKAYADTKASAGVTKSAVAAALTAQGISSADNLDDMDALAAQIAKIVAVLEALD